MGKSRKSFQTRSENHSRRKKLSAEDVNLPRDKSNSFQGSNQENASCAENSAHSPQNVEEIAKNRTGSQPVTSQTVKKTARKSTGGLKKPDWTITDVTVGHSSGHSSDNIDNWQTTGKENSPPENTDLSGDKTNSSLERNKELDQFLPPCSPEVRGRLLKIGEEQLSKEVTEMVARKHHDLHDDTAEFECSSDGDDDRLQFNIKNIISNADLFGVENVDDSGLPEKSTDSDTEYTRCRSESVSPLSPHKSVQRQKKTAATRQSRIDRLHRGHPASRKRVSERGYSHDDDSDIVILIPKRLRGTKEKNKPVNSTTKSIRRKSASRVADLFASFMQNCSVVVKRLSLKDLHHKTMARNDPMSSDEENKKSSHASRKTQQSKASKRKAVSFQYPEDESFASNRKKGSLHSDSDSSSIAEPVKKKAAIPVQHGKARHMRKSAAAVRKLFGNERSDESSNESNKPESDDDTELGENEHTHDSPNSSVQLADESSDESDKQESEGENEHTRDSQNNTRITPKRGRRPKKKAHLTSKRGSGRPKKKAVQLADESSDESDKQESEGENEHARDSQNNTHLTSKRGRDKPRKKGKTVSSIDKSTASNRQKDSSYNDSDSSSITEPVRQKSAPLTSKRGRVRPRIKGRGKPKKKENVSSKDKSVASNRQKDSSYNDSDSSSIAEPVRRKSAPLTSKRGRVRPRKKEKTVSSKDESVASNRQKDSSYNDSDSSSISEPVKQKSAHLTSKRGRGSPKKKEKTVSSKDESVASNRQKDSSYNDSDSSSISEPVKQKNAAPAPHRITRRVRKSAIAAKKLLKNVEQTDESSSDESDKGENSDASDLEGGNNSTRDSLNNRKLHKGFHSSEHSVLPQCVLKLRRLPIDRNSKSVVLTASFLNDISPAHGALKRSRGRPKKNDATIKKGVDEDWRSDDEASSSSESSECDESSEDSVVSSGSDSDYEPSDCDTDDVYGMQKTVLNYSSGSDSDYKVPTSEDEMEPRFSSRLHSKMQKKLRKSTKKRSRTRLQEPESSKSSSSSSDSSSSDESQSSSDNGEDKHSHDGERIKQTDSSPVRRRLSSSDGEQSGHADMENTKPDAPPVSRRFPYSDTDESGHEDMENVNPDAPPVSRRLSFSDTDESDHEDMENVNPDSPTEKHRSQKSASVHATRLSEKGRTSQQRSSRSQMSSGVSRRSRKDLSSMSPLNNSDVENLNSGPLMPSRTRNQQKKKTFGTRNVASSAFDDDALRSVFNIYPCQVVCQRVTCSSSDSHSSST